MYVYVIYYLYKLICKHIGNYILTILFYVKEIRAYLVIYLIKVRKTKKKHYTKPLA